MSTPLVKPITREVLVTGTSYKVTMTPEHLKLVQKGGRKGVEISWDDLLAIEHRVESAIAPVTMNATEEPARTPARSILNEVAHDLRAATASLARADEVLTQAGALPPALMGVNPIRVRSVSHGTGGARYAGEHEREGRLLRQRCR